MSNSLQVWVVKENTAEECMSMPHFRVDVSLSSLLSKQIFKWPRKQNIANVLKWEICSSLLTLFDITSIHLTWKEMCKRELYLHSLRNAWAFQECFAKLVCLSQPVSNSDSIERCENCWSGHKFVSREFCNHVVECSSKIYIIWSLTISVNTSLAVLTTAVLPKVWLLVKCKCIHFTW